MRLGGWRAGRREGVREGGGRRGGGRVMVVGRSDLLAAEPPHPHLDSPALTAVCINSSAGQQHQHTL